VEEEISSCISKAWPAEASRVLAVLVTVSVVPEMVRLRVAASAPLQVKGEMTVEMGGSHSVEPVERVRVLTSSVLNGLLVKLHSSGSAGSIVKALLAEADQSPEAVTFCTLLTSPPTALPAAQP
jgi:hypothetical protein